MKDETEKELAIQFHAVADGLYEAAMAIQELRDQVRGLAWRVERLEQLKHPSNTWWEILGTSPRADRVEIDRAFAELADRHHPDVGGSPAQWQRIRKAYKEAIE